ncbi:MAG: hypothetical protein AAF479_05675 [Pseudomonadota bacterium]
MTHKSLANSLGGTLLASTFAVGLYASAAAACDRVHYLAFDVEDGAFTVDLNGTEVFEHDGGYAQGSLTLRGGLVEGENLIGIAYTDGDSGEAAEFQILRGCEGAFPEDTPLATATVTGTGSHELAFSSAVTTAALPSTDQYEVTDGAGVVDALHRLQDAVKAGDLETIYALHAPFFAKIDAMGAPMDRVRMMISASVERGTLEADPAPSVTALDGGSVYELATAKGTPPITLEEQLSNGFNSWSTGSRWVRIDGVWGVIQPD